jgi:hypothetical protein
MSSTISVAAVLFLFAAARAAPSVSHQPPPIPEAVFAHPAAESAPELQTEPPRWSAQALSAWPGPWIMVMREGGYDHRYITW